MSQPSDSPSPAGAARPAPGADAPPAARRLVALSLAALGVVFGDISTSPLYAVRECFHGEYGIEPSAANVVGVLSLMFWSLVLIVTVKYLAFVLRADNDGEGGVIALTALVRPRRGRSQSRRWLLVALGVFAACLLYGDGMITPAISVISAVEGIRIITPLFQPYVIPLTVIILAGLFLLQCRGTAKVGRLFGPVILVWLSALAVLGLVQIVRSPRIVEAVFPWHGLGFLARNQLHGFLVLGAVFLVVTGTEALYADMGHFGPRPIRLTWVSLVLPALVLNYFGQGALLLDNPAAAEHPFYALVPSWALTPMVVLATAATIIASQAVITGSFSLTRQAIQLGYLPRMRIVHTAAAHRGQIYVASINWTLMLCTIGLVLGFRSSSKLAAAYGVAVTSTMLITTILFYVVARRRWGWPWAVTLGLCGLFLLVDVAFFAANISKILHGAWFPLVIGAAGFILMSTWQRGRRVLAGQLRKLTPELAEFQQRLERDPPHKVNGQAVFLCGNPEVAPAALVHNLRHNKVLHAETFLLHFQTEDIPRVPNRDKVDVEKLGGGLFRIMARYGYMEEPHMENAISLAREKGLELRLEDASFFLGRAKLSLARPSPMGRWRARLFLFMSRNAAEAASFFRLPSSQVIEVGVPLEI
ncbi:MAG TPA: potassium transporter Kup [Planctomycetaceae bacterium]|nr:potassium transporter Kup [Planctomycetaceae bacterium]